MMIQKFTTEQLKLLKTCSGTILFSKKKVLVSHTTKDFESFQKGNPPKDDDQWTINKGGIDEGEDSFDAAIRETYEETNINLKDFPKLLSNVKTHVFEFNTFSKKHVKVYLIQDEEGLLQNCSLKCNSWVESLSIPEVDAFQWVSIEEARKMVLKPQKWMFEKEIFEKALLNELQIYYNQDPKK